MTNANKDRIIAILDELLEINETKMLVVAKGVDPDIAKDAFIEDRRVSLVNKLHYLDGYISALESEEDEVATSKLITLNPDAKYILVLRTDRPITQEQYERINASMSERKEKWKQQGIDVIDSVVLEGGIDLTVIEKANRQIQMSNAVSSIDVEKMAEGIKERIENEGI